MNNKQKYLKKKRECDLSWAKITVIDYLLIFIYIFMSIFFIYYLMYIWGKAPDISLLFLRFVAYGGLYLILGFLFKIYHKYKL